MNPPPTSWVPFIAAFATLFAAMVALFKEDVVKLWRRPKLDMRIMLASPDCARMPVVVQYKYVTFAADSYLRLASESFGSKPSLSEFEKQWRGQCYFFRLWISNKGNLAERVQVYVESISRLMGDERPKIVEEFIPMNLRWADSPDPETPLIFESINPAMGRYCDFATVSEPSNPTETIREGMEEGESTFNLQTQVTPNTQGNRLKPGKYIIKLLVAASNAKPKAFTINLEWRGRYVEDESKMFAEAVKLKLTK